jgi:hypothetical protein
VHVVDDSAVLLAGHESFQRAKGADRQHLEVRKLPGRKRDDRQATRPLLERTGGVTRHLPVDEDSAVRRDES